MIKVLFFARLREELACDSLSVDFAGSVAELKAALLERGVAWSALEADNIVCAVNQSVAKDSQIIQAGDEVAFYPPVTGG
ncbi:molybdopterin converting factor subunit 1 [Spongiibacter sp. KMU-158]|uniref:Molybdopterin synthase sulfur carrier subunit n=1 Tax=Spongiibacter pelagi TaxID=2760804 RepID=A0A927GWK2_9GAMM|nr:molybdopterin converting factor subunit 1 [Spongiibacter pelagi]MBD2859203.1 molybdopterin converting factor subunit 1 [Spongiibacter pelagi]